MSKCESNVDELIVPGLVGIPGTVSSRLADYRDLRPFTAGGDFHSALKQN